MSKYDKIMSILISVYMIIVPIGFYKIKIFKVPITADLILAVIICLYLLKILFSKNERQKFKCALYDFFHDYLCICITALLAIMIISIFYSKEKGLAMNETFRFLSYIILFFIIKYDFKETINKIVLKVFILISFVLSTFGIIQFFTNIGLNKNFISSRRITSTFENPNHFGAFLMLAMFPVIMLMIYEKNKSKKLAYCILSLLIFASMVMTGSRNAYLGFVLACIVLCILINWKLIWILISTCIAAVFINPIGKRFIQITDESQNISRINLWKTAIKMIKDNPIFGVGNGNYVSNYDLYTTKYKIPKFEGLKRYPSHNSYLKVESELGIVGIVSFIGMLFMIFNKLRVFVKECSNNYYRSFYIGFLASLIAFYFMNISDNLLFVPNETSYFWILVATFESISFKKKMSYKVNN